METQAERPLSYKEFLEKSAMIDGLDAVRAHGDTLYQYRLAKAVELGLSLDDLHTVRQTKIQESEK